MTQALEAHLRRQIEHSRRFFWQRLRWRVVREYLPVKDPFTLVDVGAGAGLLGEFLQRDRQAGSYEFVEPIESLREYLVTRHGASADLTQAAGYGDAKFVALLDVLEHQERDHEFLDQLVAKMLPGSMLLLTVPAKQSLWSAWDVELGHFRRYEKKSLLKCAQDLPLDVLETSYLFPEMVPLAMARARRGARAAAPEGNPSAEFPDLPGFVNEALYGFGSVSLAGRRRWRTGTSLFLAATKTR